MTSTLMDFGLGIVLGGYLMVFCRLYFKHYKRTLGRYNRFYRLTNGAIFAMLWPFVAMMVIVAAIDDWEHKR